MALLSRHIASPRAPVLAGSRWRIAAPPYTSPCLLQSSPLSLAAMCRIDTPPFYKCTPLFLLRRVATRVPSAKIGMFHMHLHWLTKLLATRQHVAAVLKPLTTSAQLRWAWRESLHQRGNPKKVWESWLNSAPNTPAKAEPTPDTRLS